MWNSLVTTCAGAGSGGAGGGAWAGPGGPGLALCGAQGERQPGRRRGRKARRLEGRLRDRQAVPHRGDAPEEVRPRAAAQRQLQPLHLRPRGTSSGFGSVPASAAAGCRPRRQRGAAARASRRGLAPRSPHLHKGLVRVWVVALPPHHVVCVRQALDCRGGGAAAGRGGALLRCCAAAPAAAAAAGRAHRQQGWRLLLPPAASSAGAAPAGAAGWRLLLPPAASRAAGRRSASASAYPGGRAYPAQRRRGSRPPAACAGPRPARRRREGSRAWAAQQPGAARPPAGARAVLAPGSAAACSAGAREGRRGKAGAAPHHVARVDVKVLVL
jgi:hypothetical protein